MGYIAECARYHHDTGNTANVAVPVTAAVAVGQTVLLAIDCPVTGAVTGFAVTDSKGNTWTVQVTENSTQVNWQLALATCTITTALTTSDTITVTVTGANPAKWAVLGAVFDDLTGVDVTGHGSGSSSSVAMGPTGTASQNAQLVAAVLGWVDASGVINLTPGAGYTDAGKITAASGSGGRSLTILWGYVDGAGTRSVDATLTAGTGWGWILAAINQTGAAPATAYYWFNDAGEKIPMTLTQL